jgi:hypothetical protein
MYFAGEKPDAVRPGAGRTCIYSTEIIMKYFELEKVM